MLNPLSSSVVVSSPALSPLRLTLFRKMCSFCGSTLSDNDQHHKEPVVSRRVCLPPSSTTVEIPAKLSSCKHSRFSCCKLFFCTQEVEAATWGTLGSVVMKGDFNDCTGTAVSDVVQQETLGECFPSHKRGKQV